MQQTYLIPMPNPYTIYCPRGTPVLNLFIEYLLCNNEFEKYLKHK